jgi:hypothetical protein
MKGILDTFADGVPGAKSPLVLFGAVVRIELSIAVVTNDFLQGLLFVLQELGAFFLLCRSLHLGVHFLR